MKLLRQLIPFLILISSNLSAAAPPFQNVNGPNCLNAAMVSVGLSKHYRYASNGEMQTMLNSPLCRRLTNGEERAYNDIGLILDNGPYATKGIISHAFVQLSRDQVFEKHGYSKTDPYQVVNLQNVFQEYEVDQNPACLQNQFDRKACRMGTDYYRCGNLEQFITSHQTEIRKYTIGFFRQLEKIEKKLQDSLAAGEPLKNKQLEIARDLQVLARKMMNVPESDALPENLIFNIIANRFVSIAGQLNATGYRDLRNAVWTWENQGKNIGEIFEIISKLEIQDDLDLVYFKARSKFLSIYAPTVKIERNVPLNLFLDNEEPNMAAGVSLYKAEAHIGVGADLHRNPNINPDAYLAMLCHEVGHLLGGKPYSANTMKPSPQWASNTPSSSEGQSDYFSSLVCMKKVFAETNASKIVDIAVTPKIKNLCERQYPKILDQNICKRSIKAGYDLMLYISSIYSSFGPLTDFLKMEMDASEGRGLSVGQMYPSLQCRFDTIVAGALNRNQPDCWFVGP